MDSYAKFVEAGRKLASLREDLIAEGVDPSELLIPRLPEDCPPGEIELIRGEDDDG